MDISPQEREIILETKRSFLYTGDTVWVKKGNRQFNIAMGAFDGAETTDIVGLYLLSQLQEIAISKSHTTSTGMMVSAGQMLQQEPQKKSNKKSPMSSKNMG